MSWNLFKKWQSKVASSQIFPNAFVCLWHHPPGDRDGDTEAKCCMTCRWVTDPGSSLGPDSNGGWLPGSLPDPSSCPCWKEVCKKRRKLMQLGGAWLMVTLYNWHGPWKFTLGDCNTFTAHFVATCDKGNNQSAFQKVGRSYLLTKHSAVKLAQSHGPYKYQVPFPASSSNILHPPLVFQAFCRSTQSTNNWQPWGSSTCSLLFSSSSSRLLQVRSTVNPAKNERACGSVRHKKKQTSTGRQNLMLPGWRYVVDGTKNICALFLKKVIHDLLHIYCSSF